jgi:uncharacterized protein (TIGR00369 family)
LESSDGFPPISANVIRMDADALNSFLTEIFPHATAHRRGTVVRVVPSLVEMNLEPDVQALRPGGLISGPTQMALADVAAYALVLAHIGPVAMAVTSGLNYQFLRPCLPATLTAKAEMLKLGRKLAVMDVRIYSGDDARAVGQATVTYAIPLILGWG